MNLQIASRISAFLSSIKSVHATVDTVTALSDRTVSTFITSRATQAIGLDMFMASERVCNSLVLFKNSKSKSQETLGQISNFIYLFPINSRYKNILLMLVFLKTPFLVLRFSYYTPIILLMIISVISVSLLKILTFYLDAIDSLICGNYQS